MSSVLSGNRSSQAQKERIMTDNMSVYSSESTVVVSNKSRRAIQELFGSHLGSFSKSQKITKMHGSNGQPTDWQHDAAAQLQAMSDYVRNGNLTEAQRRWFQTFVDEWNQEVAPLEPVINAGLASRTNAVQQGQPPLGLQDRHRASQRQSVLAGRLQGERHNGAVTGLDHSTESTASLSGISVNVNPYSVDSVSTITDNNSCAAARAVLRARNVANDTAAHQSEAGPDAPMTVLPSASNANNGIHESNLVLDREGTFSILTESPAESIGQPFGSPGSDVDVASGEGEHAPPL